MINKIISCEVESKRKKKWERGIIDTTPRKKERKKERESWSDMHFTHTRCVFVRQRGNASGAYQDHQACRTGLPGGEEHEFDVRFVG